MRIYDLAQPLIIPSIISLNQCIGVIRFRFPQHWTSLPPYLPSSRPTVVFEDLEMPSGWGMQVDRISAVGRNPFLPGGASKINKLQLLLPKESWVCHHKQEVGTKSTEAKRQKTLACLPFGCSHQWWSGRSCGVLFDMREFSTQQGPNCIPLPTNLWPWSWAIAKKSICTAKKSTLANAFIDRMLGISTKSLSTNIVKRYMWYIKANTVTIVTV